MSQDSEKRLWAHLATLLVGAAFCLSAAARVAVAGPIEATWIPLKPEHWRQPPAWIDAHPGVPRILVDTDAMLRGAPPLAADTQTIPPEGGPADHTTSARAGALDGSEGTHGDG